MATIFITGSSAGIGRETAETLVHMGHRVVLHARDNARARDAEEAVPGAAAVVVGDLASLDQTRALGEAARDEGPFDVVIHNAGVGGGNSPRTVTVDGLERIFQINALAPYVLTAIMQRPARLIYLSSGLHERGTAVVGRPAVRPPSLGRRAGPLGLEIARRHVGAGREQALAGYPHQRRRPRLDKDAHGRRRTPPTRCRWVPRPRFGWPPATNRRPW